MTSSIDDAAATPTPPLMADSNSPWGGGGNDSSGGDKPKGSPWLPPGGRGGGGGGGGGPRRPSGLDDMLRRGPFGPQMPKLPGGRNAWALIGGGFVALWLVFTSVHQLSAGEEGVVTRLGSYSRTMGPGIQFTLPSPIERMEEVSTLEIRTINIPDGDAQNLVLTGDANIINLAYTVRWNIRDPERYLFQLKDADGTVRDAAESAMRATIANFTLAQAIGSGRDAIETQVQTRLQTILDGYNSGIRIEGIAIRDSAAPTEVEEAFNNVNAAQQRSEGFLNEARGYASQVVARAEGDAAAFDRIYEQYRLAPEVTRRRLYYETMEYVLARSEKTVVDSGGVVPYMALPEARRRSAQTATPATPAPATNQGARP
jgi:modulator of FtsH protease HflK